jgi:hypothetical protein
MRSSARVGASDELPGNFQSQASLHSLASEQFGEVTPFGVTLLRQTRHKPTRQFVVFATGVAHECTEPVLAG